MAYVYRDSRGIGEFALLTFLGQDGKLEIKLGRDTIFVEGQELHRLHNACRDMVAIYKTMTIKKGDQ